MRVIHLIRHARPAVSGVMLGRTDVPLADEAVAAFPGEVDYVFASPLRRAMRTAELMFPGREIAMVPEFAERGLGEWETLPWPEIGRRWPDAAARAEENWFVVTPPGGEPWVDFLARVERGWRQLPGSGTIAVVAHAGVNAVCRSLSTGEDMIGLQQDYCEVISLDLPDCN
jgi:broad specificity phosphatase PhoE